MLGHVFPNLLNSIIVLGSLEIAYNILRNRFSAFWVGTTADSSWGGCSAKVAPHADALVDRRFPGLAIFVTTLGINLLGTDCGFTGSPFALRSSGVKGRTLKDSESETAEDFGHIGIFRQKRRVSDREGPGSERRAVYERKHLSTEVDRDVRGLALTLTGRGDSLSRLKPQGSELCVVAFSDPCQHGSMYVMAGRISSPYDIFDTL